MMSFGLKTFADACEGVEVGGGEGVSLENVPRRASSLGTRALYPSPSPPPHLQPVVVYQPRLFVDAVGQRSEVHRRRADLPLLRVVPVGEVAPGGQVEAHDPVVRFEEARVDSKVGGGAGVGLDVDSPV